MRVGLIVRILALQAVVFLLAALALPLVIFQLPRAAAVIYLAATFALILALSGALIAWRIVRPLQRLIDAAEDMGGAGSALWPEQTRGDEVGRLSRALNRMVRRLEERQRELESTVSELKVRGDALERAREALLRSERLASVGRLAAGVAHEVGNPLASIQGYSALAADEMATEADRADYLARIGSEVERIHLLLRDLMDYARPSAPSLEPLDPQRPVEAALNLAEAQTRFRNVRVTRRYPERALWVLGDESRILQVALNLILNAADAMHGEGSLEIRIEEVGQRVAIRVVDAGPGIAEEDQQRIFEPFFTTKGAGKGTGLGLAICKSLVESLGGELQLKSAPGKGAMFSVLLSTMDGKREGTEAEGEEKHDSEGPA